MQQQTQKKNNKSSLRVLLSALAVLIVAAAAYRLWPKAKDSPPAVEAAASDNCLSLTAILYTEDNPTAVVNNTIVHEQDIIGEAKVLKIHKHKVEFQSPDRRWTQTMSGAVEGVASGLPVLLEIGSNKCPPCRQMTAILNELKAQYADKFHVRYIDIEQSTAACEKYGVNKIPTHIFLDNSGNELFRQTGFYTKQQILDAWKNLGLEL